MAKKTRKNYRKSIIIISMILLLLVCVLGVNAATLRARNQAYQQQEIELVRQIEEQERRAEELAEYAALIDTDEYIRRIAEDKLGLMNPDDIMFVPVEVLEAVETVTEDNEY